VWSATDPYALGDDGGLVIAAVDGWWVRVIREDVELDWFESVVQDYDITPLLQRLLAFGQVPVRAGQTRRIYSPTRCSQCRLTSKVTSSLFYGGLYARTPFTYLIADDSWPAPPPVGSPTDLYGCIFQIDSFYEFEIGEDVIFQGREEDEQRTPDNHDVDVAAIAAAPSSQSIFFKFYGTVHTPRHGTVGISTAEGLDNFTCYLGGHHWNGWFGVGGAHSIGTLIFDNPWLYDPKGRNCGLDINDPSSPSQGARNKRFNGGGALIKNVSGVSNSRWGGATPGIFLVQGGIESYGTPENPVIQNIVDFWHTDSGVRAADPTWFWQHKSDGGNPVDGKRLYMRWVHKGKTTSLGYQAEATPEGRSQVFRANRYTIEFVDESDNGAVGGFTAGEIEDFIRQDDNVPGSFWSTQYFNPGVDEPLNYSWGESKDHDIKGRLDGLNIMDTGTRVHDSYFPARTSGNPWAQINIHRSTLQRWTRPDNFTAENCTFEESPQWPEWNPAADTVGQHAGQIIIHAGQGHLFKNLTFLGSPRKIMNIVPGDYYGGSQADRDKKYGAGLHPINASYEPEHEQITIALENITAPAGCWIDVEQRVGPQGLMWAPLSRVTITLDGVEITEFPYVFGTQA
jgi:hypothetical protein